MSRDYDVIVVGAGPAGLTAGLYTGRAWLSTVILERMGPGGQLLNTDLIEDYTGFKSITGFEMATLFEEHAREFGAETEYGEVEEIWTEGHWKLARTTDGEVFRAKALILTSGGMPRKLGVPGEAEFAEFMQCLVEPDCTSVMSGSDFRQGEARCRPQRKSE